MKFKQRYRLGLDIGTNSIGWCVLRLDENDQPIGIIRAGSRIFSDGRSPKTLASLAADRRQKRQMRRRHDRALKRQARFMEGLIRFDLMPMDDEERLKLSALDPYELRRKGLDQPLTIFELGRALYHLAKRRGFKSSRKTKGEDENESGKIKGAIKKTRNLIAESGCRTLGEYLAKRHEQRETVRARSTADGKDYLLYTQRTMVEEEFDALWSAQAPHHPDVCTDEARAWLRDTLLFQRKLLPVEPGMCPFEPDESRIPVCSPLFQRFRLLQDLNHSHIIEDGDERSLTLDERNTLLQALTTHTGKPMTFAQMGKAISLSRSAKFNFEKDSKRSGFKGDATALLAAAAGASWSKLSSLQQEALAVLVEEASDDDVLRKALQELPASLATMEKEILRGSRPQVQAWRDALANLPAPFGTEAIDSIVKISLPDDYASLSRKALEKIVPIMEASVITYDKAAKQAGYNHSDGYDGVVHERLPYYGQLLRGYTSPTPKAHNEDERRFGKIANPTVHIGLNQLRQLVNEIIRRWGQPTEIIVELARDFGLSGQKRRDLESEQKQNQERNDKLNERLRGMNQRENRENRQRLTLWDELGKDDAMDRYCIYSGQRMSMAQLFNGDIEIDHILPFSRSLDDSLSNKVLCLSRANRDKKNQTPFKAFGHSPGIYNWQGIKERAARFGNRNKAKRFEENALESFLGEKDFLDRHLTDTAYLSRVARQYLTAVCPPNKVWVATGRLTAMIRDKFGLNKILNPDDPRKNRDDHRHHAVDAAVIAICNRSLIQKISAAAASAEDLGGHRLLKDLQEPWPSFRDELASVISKIVVSHKPDHGREDALHNDTNYGKRGDADKKGVMKVSTRKPIFAITSSNVGNIAGDAIRDELTALFANTPSKEIKAALEAYAQRTGIRHVQMQEKLSVIAIEDRMTKQPYRYVKGDGNYCYDIFREDNGKWNGDVVSTYDANRPDFKLNAKTARNGKPLVMRLRKGDLLKLEHEGKFKIMRIAKFSDGKINMAAHNESNVDARNRNPEVQFSYLQKSPDALRPLAARVVGVDILGYVNDPGFKE